GPSAATGNAEGRLPPVGPRKSNRVSGYRTTRSNADHFSVEIDSQVSNVMLSYSTRTLIRRSVNSTKVFIVDKYMSTLMPCTTREIISRVQGVADESVGEPKMRLAVAMTAKIEKAISGLRNCRVKDRRACIRKTSRVHSN